LISQGEEVELTLKKPNAFADAIIKSMMTAGISNNLKPCITRHRPFFLVRVEALDEFR
jgi:hypothetical protein